MRRVFLPALVVMCLASAGPGTAAETSVASLAQRIEKRLAAAGVPDGEIGIAVLTLGETPKPVFGKNQSIALMPASVAKVLTAAAALDLLGPAHEFTTTVSAHGAIEGGVLQGDLVVHGTGDPNLSGRLTGKEPTAVLDDLAGAVRAAGVREVRGDLVLDDGAFDRDFTHFGWTDADKEKWYGAPVGGLAFNDSCLAVTVTPAGELDVNALLSLPATSGAWDVQNLTTTFAGTRHVVGATWSTATRVLQVRGNVAREGGTYTFQVPAPDPVAFFGGALLRRLDAGGVRVRGAMRLASDPAERGPGRVLARHATGLAETLEVMNRRSQNFYASQVFKACGAAFEGTGSWDTGRLAVEEMLRRRGLSDDGKTAIVDGSGLAKLNRTTAATVALLLLRFDQDLLRGPLLHRSLAAPGEEGTLDDRLLTRATKGRLRAKTGTLAQAGAHAIAGYLEGRRGEPGVCFAILVNKRSWRGDPRGLIDDLVGILAAP
jgi:serine-type D-Ala-D-Ala carboxypeptidase/endopeptidase (penicillin-binding protein 4)